MDAAHKWIPRGMVKFYKPFWGKFSDMKTEINQVGERKKRQAKLRYPNMETKSCNI